MSSDHRGGAARTIGFLSCAVLFASAGALPASSEWPWSGTAWADYRAFMSPITSPIKNHLRTIVAAGVSQARVAGRMGQIGNSITNASPYFRNTILNGPTGNETGHDYSDVRSWLAYGGAAPADANSFYRDHGKEAAYGNASGWTLEDTLAAGHPGAAVTVGSGVTPGDFSWALVMFGTNDIDDLAWEPVAWAATYSGFVQDFIDLGVAPVLSTIPPETAHVGDDRVEEANVAIRALAEAMKVPYVDLYELILHYQPTSWAGTLISSDGTHPSAGGGGRDFSEDGLTSSDGYAARTKLTFDFAEKLESIVFENGLPEPATNELFSDDFESGDASAWSSAFPATSLDVNAASVFSGGLGLAVTLDGCNPVDLVLTAPPAAVTGNFIGCETLTASDVEVVAPGATFTAGTEVALVNGFSVGSGAHFTAGLIGELADPFAYVEDSSPDDLLSYGATFYVNFDGLTLDIGDELDVFNGLAADGTALFRITLVYGATLDENQLVLSARLNDGTFAQTPLGEELSLPSGYNMIEVSWNASDGSGELLVGVNSALLAGLENLSNSLGRLSLVQLGAVGGTLTTSAGTLHFDEFQSVP